MAKKQTRRSVSIRGSTYDRVRQYCERAGISMSEFVEERIASFFDAGRPAVKPPARPKAKLAKGNGNGGDSLSFDELQDATRFFTF